MCEMKTKCFYFSILGAVAFFLVISCKKESETFDLTTGPFYDIVLVIGQSNTHQGIGFDSILDKPDENIKQLGRFNENNFKIILAREPLDHISKLTNQIGFALTFAKAYTSEYLKTGHQVLIIPGGRGSTGFDNHYWNKGDTLYNDAVNRTNHVLNHFHSRLVAILWHQGEDDVYNINYQANLDSMIINIRKDIIGNNIKVPFILGGMVPYWVKQDSNRMLTNNIIENTVNRIETTGYANPCLPFLIEKEDNDYISIHFDAQGQREMGRRYFKVYKHLNPATLK